jgi:hypothetical protein
MGGSKTEERKARNILELKFIVSGLCFFIILTTAFLHDATFSEKPSQGFQKNDIWEKGLESAVYARLAKSAQDGLLSAGGLMGFCYDDPVSFTKNHLFDEKYQINLYKNRECPNYGIYKSHPAGQALLFSIIGRVSGTPFTFNLVTAMLLAAMLTLWLIWISHYFGLWSAAFTTAGMLFLPWLIILGDNMYLVVGIMFLPMVAITWALEKQWNKLFIISFASFLFETLMTGPNFIFCAMIMSVVPVVFYAIKDKWGYKKMRRNILTIAFGSILACSLSFAILMAQISSVSSFKDAIGHVIYTAESRSHGDPDNFTGKIKSSLESSVVPLIDTYLDITAIRIRNVTISFRLLILMFFVTSLGTLILRRRTRNPYLLPLLITTWFSVLSPLSWFIIAKGHSAEHIFLNPIVWHMPFVLFGVALVSVTITESFSIVKHNESKPPEVSATGVPPDFLS